MTRIARWLVLSSCLLAASCGGSIDSGSIASSGSGSNTATAGSAPNTVSSGSSTNPASGNADSSANCQVIGGNLFVAEQGRVGVTLLSDGGLGPLVFDDLSTFGRGFMVLYDDVFGMQAASNPQDKFAYAKPFAPGTAAGASAQVQLQQPPPDFIVGSVPSTYPKGVPLQLWLKISDGNPPSTANSSGTASIGKDLWPYSFPTASVTYGANNTATVTFFASADGAHFTVGLTNVFGTSCPSG